MQVHVGNIIGNLHYLLCFISNSDWQLDARGRAGSPIPSPSDQLYRFTNNLYSNTISRRKINLIVHLKGFNFCGILLLLLTTIVFYLLVDDVKLSGINISQINAALHYWQTRINIKNSIYTPMSSETEHHLYRAIGRRWHFPVYRFFHRSKRAWRSSLLCHGPAVPCGQGVPLPTCLLFSVGGRR